ncbi:MAG TPA: hypothetical protein DEA22_12400 [Blastocatellia bacterium]|nr:hypothetical protein [Blastocatellia bacterium]
MEELRLTYQDVLYYFTIVSLVLGALFGSFPMIVGLKLKNRKYAAFGFGGAIVGGLLGVLVSFVVAFVFTLLILRNASAGNAAEEISSEDAGEIPPESDSDAPTEI